MKRLIFNDLLQWKNSSRRKPLMLEGARQVGKTFLLKALGKQAYDHFYYLNFDEMPKARSLFEGNIKAKTLIEKLSIYFQEKIDPASSLICFDEIQECDAALASLKYFYEDAPEYHIAAAGSLLGVKLKGKKGFPVGKVSIKEIFPLSFTEYLLARNKTGWIELLDSLTLETKVSDIFHNELIESLKTYMFIGGMPEAIDCYCDTHDFQEVRKIQQDILRTYELDFAKHASNHDTTKISLVWDKIPSQLAKENKKFIYSAIKQSARGREYESAIQWLMDANLLLRCSQISKPSLPINSYANLDIFKTYMLDVGLLGAKSYLNERVMLDGEQLFQEYKGSLTENYVAQSLQHLLQMPLYYWTSSGRAEVDFIIEHNANITPLEVKSSSTKHKKSLQVYNDKYAPKQLIRISPMNVQQQENFINIPLYAVDQLPRLLSSMWGY